MSELSHEEVARAVAAKADLWVYWCPRCNRQSEKPVHFCRKGPALIPQLDEETTCFRFKVALV